MLFTFENGVPLLMNGFNKTKAAVFSCRLCFLGAFPFISSILAYLSHVQFLFDNVNEDLTKSMICAICTDIFYVFYDRRKTI